MSAADDNAGVTRGNLLDIKVLKRVFSYVKPYKGLFGAVLFLTIFSAGIAPIRPYLISYMIDNQIANRDLQGLITFTFILIGLMVVQAIAQYFHTFSSESLGQSVIRDIRIQLYRHIVQMRVKFFDNTQIGRLVTRNISDIETLSDIFSQGFAAIVGDLLQLVFILSIMFYTNWKLTLISLSMLPILLFSTYIFKEKIKKSFNEVRNAVSQLNAFVQEHITGMSIVQIFNSEEREFKKFEKINRDHLKANLRSVNYYSIYFPVAEVIGCPQEQGFWLWYGAKGILAEEVTLGVMIAFIMYISMFFRPIRMIADRFNTLQMGVVSSERIFRLLDSSDMIQNTGTYKPEKINGHVKFDKVVFGYDPEQPVLKGISFEIPKGGSLALVGATGAGKTSTINLLNRFYDIQEGQILIDGRNIKEYDVYQLRKHIGLVLQDVFLFSESILNNITLRNPDIPFQKVKEAAEFVGADEFISKLPGGYDYNVMERGSTLSVGQRQLISFIRALVYDPEVIILDEATSSVDVETEELIQTAIAKMMKGRTSLVIAHRLSTIEKADEILVMDHGEIVERGHHEQLLKENGVYRNLYELQFKNVPELQ